MSKRTEKQARQDGRERDIMHLLGWLFFAWLLAAILVLAYYKLG